MNIFSILCTFSLMVAAAPPIPKHPLNQSTQTGRYHRKNQFQFPGRRRRLKLFHPPSCSTCKGSCGKPLDLSRGCSCDSTCVLLGQCCPDFNLVCSLEYSNIISSDALSTQIKNNVTCVSQGMFGYTFVSSCPYHDKVCDVNPFNLNQYVPVMDVETKLHYINVMCAICNEIQKIKPWTIKIKKRIIDLLRQNISLDSMSISMFPKGIPRPSLCPVKSTMKCSENSEDSTTKSKCEDGSISYVQEMQPFGITYRNLYCALCNGRGLKELKCGFSLTRTIGMPSGPPPASHYSAEYLFDVHLDRGLLLGGHCTDEQKFMTDTGKCVNLIAEMNQSDYEISVNLTTKMDIDRFPLPGNMAEDMIGNILQSTGIMIKCSVSLSQRNWQIGKDYISLTCTSGTSLSLDYLLFNVSKTLMKLKEKYNMDSLRMSANSNITGNSGCSSVFSYNLDNIEVSQNGTIFISGSVLPNGHIMKVRNSSVEVCITKTANKGWVYSDMIGWITVFTLSLSIIALVLHFVFKYKFDQRQNRTDGLACSILLSHVAYLLSPWFVDKGLICSILGIVLHWSFLVYFTWILIISADLWWRTVQSSKLQISSDKSVVSSWIASVIPATVLIILAGMMDHFNINDAWRPFYGEHFCWINNRKAILIYFVLPVAGIVVCSFGFTLACYRLLYFLTNSEMSAQKHQLRMFVKLFIICGTSWTLGFIAVPLKSDILFAVFIVLNGFQGVWIFLINWCPRLSDRVSKLQRRSTYSSNTATNKLLPNKNTQ